MNLTPIPFEEPVGDPDDPLEAHESGRRTFVAHHWTWTNYVRTIVGNEVVWSPTSADGTPGPRRRIRLQPGDSNNGKLRWTEGGVTTTLEEVMSSVPGSSWSRVPDWRVSASGRSLWVITGAVPFTTASSWWSSGALYEIDLERRAVTLVHTPDGAKDKTLLRVSSVRDDQLVVLSQRALRLFLRVDEQWKEGKALRIAHGHDLQLGLVDGRTIALVRTRDAKGGATGARCFPPRRGMGRWVSAPPDAETELSRRSPTRDVGGIRAAAGSYSAQRLGHPPLRRAELIGLEDGAAPTIVRAHRRQACRPSPAS